MKALIQNSDLLHISAWASLRRDEARESMKHMQYSGVLWQDCNDLEPVGFTSMMISSLFVPYIYDGISAIPYSHFLTRIYSFKL